MRSDDEFESILKFDPLLKAEEVTGKRCGDDVTDGDTIGDTARLGFALMHAHSDAKRQALAERADTYMRMDYRLYINTLKDMGFEVALEEPFLNHYDDGRTWQNYYFILAHREHGLIVSCDTWNSESIGGGITINGSTLFFNWKRVGPGKHYPEKVGYSGGFICEEKDRSKWDDLPNEAWTLVGSVDFREASRRTFLNLTSEGLCLPQWEWNPMYSPRFSTYGDRENAGLKSTDDKERIAQVKQEGSNRREKGLPEWVRGIYQNAKCRWGR